MKKPTPLSRRRKAKLTVRRRQRRVATVTSKAIIKAYEDTGLTPAQGEFLAGGHAYFEENDRPVKKGDRIKGQRLIGEACAIGVYAIAKTFVRDHHPDQLNTASVARYLGLPIEFVRGLTWGFDGDPAPWDKAQARGWKVGDEVRRHFGLASSAPYEHELEDPYHEDDII